MSNSPSVYQEPNAEAIALARRLLRSARFGSLAVLEPDDGGFPHASRVALGMDIDGVPVTLVSGLAAHTRALHHDPRCSLLVGEVGKGDPSPTPDEPALSCSSGRRRLTKPSHAACPLPSSPPESSALRRPSGFPLLPTSSRGCILEWWIRARLPNRPALSPDHLACPPVPCGQGTGSAGHSQYVRFRHSETACNVADKEDLGTMDRGWAGCCGLDLASKDQFLRVEFNHELASVDELAL